LVGIEKNLRKLAMKMRSKMPTRERVGSLWRLLLLPVGEARSAKDSRPSAVVSPALLLLVAVLMGLIALPGCGGCKGSGTSASAKKKSKNDEDKKKSDEEVLEELEKRKKKLEKPKDDFEPLAVRMLPSNDPSPSLKQPPILVKPGHWTAISVTAKTNNFDFPGELTNFTSGRRPTSR